MGHQIEAEKVDFEPDFMLSINKKVLRTLQLTKTEKAQRLLTWHQNVDKQASYLKLASFSVSATSFILLTQVPRANLNRWFRLVGYLGLGYGYLRINKMIDEKVVIQTFDSVTRKNKSNFELEELYRQFKVRKFALEKDKKDLKKYKWDPQSYH